MNAVKVVIWQLNWDKFIAFIPQGLCGLDKVVSMDHWWPITHLLLGKTLGCGTPRIPQDFNDVIY